MALHRLAILAALPLAACFYDTDTPLPADFGACPAGAAAPATPAAPTYWRDVKPIVDSRCAGCHVAGGIAPFALTSYADLTQHLDSAARAVEARVMPPWQPDACCNHYRDDRSMSEAQIATFLAWAAGGGLEGDPADAPPAPPPRPAGLPRVDVAVAMSEPYAPQPVHGRDDLRCFILEHDFTERTYVTGVAFHAGNRRAVHHVIVFTYADDHLDELRAKDGADGRPGWDCWGGGDELQIGAVKYIGGWQPGDGADVLPDGVGREAPAHSHIVLQVHYDTGAGGTEPDQSSLELMTAPSVERIEAGAPVGNPLWFAGEGMRIEAGDPDTRVFFSYDPTRLVNHGRGFDIHRVMVHMHDLGTIGRLAILRKDGSTDCLLNITRWDFHWMGSYYLDPPVHFEPGDKLYVECHWDNTAGNQKLIDGELEAPRTIGWGTDEEMCGGVITFSTEVT